MTGKEVVEEIVRAAEERGRYLQLRDLQIGAATTRSGKARLDRLADAIAGLIDAAIAHRCGTTVPCRIESSLARCEAEMKEGR